VKDANGQSLAYVYGREIRADADTAHALTMDEARAARYMERASVSSQRLFSPRCP
jgi:hypothetical protein